MDIMTAMSLTGQAIDIAKALRDIDKSIGTAEYKLKIAELIEALADVKVTLSETRMTLLAKEDQILDLQKQISQLSSGEACPMCRTGHLQVMSVRPHASFGRMGIQDRSLKCDNENCSYTENRMHDPSKRI